MALLLSASLAAVLLPTALAQTVCSSIAPKFTPVMGSGYQARVVMNGLKAPRGIIFDSAGNLLVVEQNGGGIRRIQLADNGDSDVCVSSSATIIPDATLNHGIQLSSDEKTLYVSSEEAVYSYPYDVASGAVGNKTTLIVGMSQTDHVTRTLLVPKSAPNSLLVQRGSNDNLDNGTIHIDSGRSQIRIFDTTNLTANTDYSTNGIVLGWGLRNSVGLTEHPITNGIWSVENSCDNMIRDGTDVHLNNPGEEMNYHGLLNDTMSAEYGSNYGYPVCFSAWDPSTLPQNTNIDVGTQFLIGDPNATYTDNLCATQRHAPRLTFPAHNAPIDIKFRPDGSAAYVSFHGSWDRDPPDGYRVSRIDFANGQPVEPSNSTTAAINIMYNANNSVCPSSCFRPAGLAFDSKGRLWVASDATGEIFIITGAQV